MTDLTPEQLSFDPAPSTDSTLQLLNLGRLVEYAALRSFVPDTEAPQSDWNQFANHAPAAVDGGPLVINAPRAAEVVKDSPYAQPGSAFLPVA